MFSITVAILLVSAYVAHVTAAATPTVVNKKCTKNDPRENLYPECMQSESLVLWCDYSSYTSVPDPDSITKSKSYNDSIALYVNDSCLPALHRHEIKKYPNIEDLDCGKNLIKELKGHIFIDNKKLRRLNLCQNEIHTVRPSAFNGLDKLEILNLTYNRISSISKTMFGGLSSLKELYLQSNQLQVLRPYTFQPLKQLEVLVLSGNKISHVDKKAFYGLKNLVRLHLDGNELSTLDEATFQTTPNLKVLTLSYNKFSIAPRFTENSLANLQNLNLGHNFLRGLEISRIANLSRLQNLSLENNSIPSVSEDSFHHMPHLRFLNLSSNGIENVDQCSFSKSCNLEVLNLSNNTLKTPYPEWFAALIRKEAVNGTDISGNQWKCNCDAIRFHEFLAELPVGWANKLTITCDWPKEHFGKRLSDVIHNLKDDLQCEYEPYNKIDRPCNSTISLTPRATEVYTYRPTTTEEDSPESTPILILEEDKSKSMSQFSAQEENESVHDYRVKPINESPNLYLVIALTLSFLAVVVLSIAVIKIHRRKSVNEAGKTESREKILPSPPSSRSDSESTYNNGRINSTDTVITVVSEQSLNSDTSSETTPFQPQGDLNNGPRVSSDSGISSMPSSLTPSEVTLSVASNFSRDRSSLEVIKEHEVYDATKIRETTPKKVLNPDQYSSDEDEEYLMFREQPIGGNADGDVC